LGLNQGHALQIDARWRASSLEATTLSPLTAALAVLSKPFPKLFTIAALLGIFNSVGLFIFFKKMEPLES
jgi:hypothetical protein